jgi:hypothetical protein
MGGGNQVTTDVTIITGRRAVQSDLTGDVREQSEDDAWNRFTALSSQLLRVSKDALARERASEK